jgi:hypothetical protein
MSVPPQQPYPPQQQLPQQPYPPQPSAQQQVPAAPPPSWRTEPARLVEPGPGGGGWRRGVTALGIVLAVLGVLVAAALLVGALRQLVGTTLYPTSAALPADVSALTVTSNHGAIVLTAGSELLVRTTGPGASFNEARIDVTEHADGAVDVSIMQPDRWFTFPVGPTRAATYEVVVPADQLESAALRTDLGDITVSSDVPTLAMETELGDIEADHTSGSGMLTARTALGDIRLTSSTADRVDARTEMGEVDIHLPEAAALPSEVSASSELGDVDISVPAAPEGHSYRVEAVTDLGTLRDEVRSDTEVPGGTSTVIHVEAATGNITVTER